MDFAPRALIDRAALKHNLRRVRLLAPDSRVWAVVKANAYGHGMVEAARALEAADGLAVARFDEAVHLRAAGVGGPLLVLGGVYTEAEVRESAFLGLELALHSPGQLELLERASPAIPLHVWLKLDTGMHRLGFPMERGAELLERLRRCAAVAAGPARLMTHLANADDPRDPLTQRQCRRLRALPEAAGALLSIGNSGGILAFAAARSHWVRPGIVLYGCSPFADVAASALGLRPAMTLEARLMAINARRRGDRVGYGGAYVCPQDMLVGVAGIGYGDGYPRHAPNGTPVMVNGAPAPLVGRVSMDLISVDLRPVPAAKVGDRVTLWGRGLPVEQVARAAGTIGYELLSGVSPRVRYEYLEVADRVAE